MNKKEIRRKPLHPKLETTMKNNKGFLNISRELPPKESVEKRTKHFNEFYKAADQELLNEQSSRCMDCGVPFCHNACPLGNHIPDFNKAVNKDDWQQAYKILVSTNNFPEFTGRICPAPCEASCVLNINNDPVIIEQIEKSIIERAFEEGWVTASKPIVRNGFTVAVVGSGPAGLASADQLNKMGYQVDLFERNDKIGGLLRYGIPDFKLEKNIIDRRIKLLEASGINMFTSVNVGYDIQVDALKEKYDAIVLAGGSTVPRDLPIKGRNLKGIYYAMDFLEQKNRIVAGEKIRPEANIDVTGKHVIVIGGGDTGADCVGTSNRLQAASITQIELFDKAPDERHAEDLWPNWPLILRTSSSHEEGCDRKWSIHSKVFTSEDGVHVSGLSMTEVQWTQGEDGRNKMIEIPNSEKIIPCDVIFLAIGFVHPQKEGLLDQLGVELDVQGNIKTEDYQTSIEGVYAAGDMRRGQSLVVWAIAEGRQVAETIDRKLRKKIKVNHPSKLAV